MRPTVHAFGIVRIDQDVWHLQDVGAIRDGSRSRLMPVFTTLILVAVTLLWCVDIRAQCPPPTYRAKEAQRVTSIELGAPSESVKIGTPAKLTVTMTNTSDHDICIYSDAKGNYRVEVRDEKAKLPPDTKFGRSRNGNVKPDQLSPEELSSSGGYVILGPRQTQVQTVNVTALYEITRPGRYSVQVSRIDPATFEEVKSDVVTITLTP
jgi:hypothetical protein